MSSTTKSWRFLVVTTPWARPRTNIWTAGIWRRFWVTRSKAKDFNREARKNRARSLSNRGSVRISSVESFLCEPRCSLWLILKTLTTEGTEFHGGIHSGYTELTPCRERAHEQQNVPSSIRIRSRYRGCH